jgi:hypothetical protein
MTEKIANPRATEVKIKVRITTGQAAATAKQVASWRRLWERLLSQGGGKEIPALGRPPHGEDKND